MNILTINYSTLEKKNYILLVHLCYLVYKIYSIIVPKKEILKDKLISKLTFYIVSIDFKFINKIII